jgi:hypothetical protein
MTLLSNKPAEYLNTLIDLIDRNPGSQFLAETRERVIIELMDRAEAEDRARKLAWTQLKLSGAKAEPAANSTTWGHVTRTYHADCVHCGGNIHQVLMGHTLGWVHTATSVVFCAR